ncbi:bola-like protein [Hygrophoropsis aurantiaca]|uniref:Bola-like protein n=1 Tax=Hygrophoropsis aurantiaca TaxID=72124 RepID=A0ACB8AUN2_9AGAM|nr:bola-like protein [Hygrophoropsis aurantiaca]
MISLTRRLLIVRPSMLRGFSTAPPPSKPLSDGEQTIYNKLSDKFSPSELAVQDVSGGCGSFYAIKIASQSFKGLSTVKQHRMVTEALKQEIEGIHGLQIKTIPPP